MLYPPFSPLSTKIFQAGVRRGGIGHGHTAGANPEKDLDRRVDGVYNARESREYT
jgi:hypothetical protein